MKHIWIELLFLVLLLSPLGIVRAQEEPADGPVYIVQAGDNLWSISQRFGVSIDALTNQNGITDPNQLTIGMQLVIPGLEGLQGVLTTAEIPFGESLHSLSRRYQIPLDLMVRLNKFTSPALIPAGASLIITDPEGGRESPAPAGERTTIQARQSLIEAAMRQRINPWQLMSMNELDSSWSAVPGDTLHLPGDDFGPGALPDQIALAVADDLPVIQGQTISVKITAPADLSLTGKIIDQQLHFFQVDDGTWSALQGIHVMLEPGYYPLEIQGSLPDGTEFAFSQPIYVQDGNYPFDPPLVVNSETVDVENTNPEDLQWADVVDPVTPEKFWRGIFESPVPPHLSECYPSMFGNRRSYNGSAYNFFHTGQDFCGRVGIDIYASAAGNIVLTEDFIVRGNATVIDHGWGVYSAYAHQSEILVQVGDRVEEGQLIGRVGETGRVSGPHLHWEVIVGGVQVDPLQWLAREFP